MKGIRCSLILIVWSVFVLVSCRNNLTLYLPVLNDIPAIEELNKPKNVILIIGDGMGPEQIRAGGIAQFGNSYGDSPASSWSFEEFYVQTTMRTLNAWGGVTDSAASATAMATGSKVNNGVLSLEIPGSGKELETLAEMARADNKSIGFVTTANVLDATPAAFAVHQVSRNNYSAIATQMIEFRPNLMFGGGKFLSVEDTQAEYTIEEDYNSWNLSFPEGQAAPFYFYGRFGEGTFPYITDDSIVHPSLDAMTEKALNLLDNDSNGFFLLVENELTDEAGHLNDLEKLVAEVDELNNAVKAAVLWNTNRGLDDTLIIVTADHETGGLKVLSNERIDGLPTVSWSTTGHTSQDVNLYAMGPDSSDFSLVRENVDIYRLISRYYLPSPITP